MIGRIYIGHVRRIIRERIIDVCILKMVVTVILYASGNVDFRIRFFKIEVVFYVKNAFVILDLPLAVKVGKPAAFLSVGKSVLARLERYVIRARIRYAHNTALFIILLKHLPYSFYLSFLYYNFLSDKGKAFKTLFRKTILSNFPKSKINFVL